MPYSNKNKVMFGRGTKTMEDFKKVTGWENMIYFNTESSEIYVGEKKYGFSEDDKVLLKSAVDSISYDETTATFTVSFVDSTKNDVTFSIPTADKKTPGLMTADQVSDLNTVVAAVLRLESYTDSEGVYHKGSVETAKDEAKEYAKGLVDSVLSEDVDASGAAIVKISQGEDGKIVAVAGDVAASHVTVDTDKLEAENVEDALVEIVEKIATFDTPSVVEEKIKNAIEGLNNDPNVAVDENDFFSISVTQEKGIVSGVTITPKADIASADSVSTLSGLVGDGFNNSDKTVAKEIARVEGLVSTLETEKVNVNAEAIAQEVKDRKEAVAKAIDDITGTLGEGEAATLEGIHDRIDVIAAAAGAISYKIEKVDDASLETNVKEAFKLVDQNGDVANSAVIKIYKDSALEGVKLTDKNAEEVEGQFLEFTYLTADGGKDVVYVDVSAFLAEAEFKDGLEVSNGEVSVKIATASESFLTVDGDGVKLSGVQEAINSAKTAAKSEVIGGASDGYQTLKDIEDKVKANAAAAAAAQTRINDKTTGFITVSSSTDPTTNAVTYTINESDDIAKASDLTTLTQKVDEEVVPAISTAEKSAKDHADAEVKALREGEVAANASAISKETEDRIKGDTDTLNAAKAYTDEALYWYEG